MAFFIGTPNWNKDCNSYLKKRELLLGAFIVLLWFGSQGIKGKGNLLQYKHTRFPAALCFENASFLAAVLTFLLLQFDSLTCDLALTCLICVLVPGAWHRNQWNQFYQELPDGSPKMTIMTGLLCWPPILSDHCNFQTVEWCMYALKLQFKFVVQSSSICWCLGADNCYRKKIIFFCIFFFFFNLPVLYKDIQYNKYVSIKCLASFYWSLKLAQVRSWMF